VLSLGLLADRLDARLEGGERDTTITNVATLSDATDSSVGIYLHRRYRDDLDATDAAAVLVSPDLAQDLQHPRIIPENPEVAFAELLEIFAPVEPLHAIHPSDAVIDPSASIHPSSHVDSGAVISSGVVVGEKCRIGANAVILSGVRIGDRVLIGPGSVIGSDGFGYVWDGTRHRKLVHIGTVLIEDDVEIGANVTVDRATLGTTTIRSGTKIDNLVQIAHNVDIGSNTLIAAQVGIAGSSTLGGGVKLAGQSGVSDHVTIGEGVAVAAKSAVMKSVKQGTIAGQPARPLAQQRRAEAALFKLPKLLRQVTKLQARIKELEVSAQGS